MTLCRCGWQSAGTLWRGVPGEPQCHTQLTTEDTKVENILLNTNLSDSVYYICVLGKWNGLEMKDDWEDVFSCNGAKPYCAQRDFLKGLGRIFICLYTSLWQDSFCLMVDISLGKMLGRSTSVYYMDPVMYLSRVSEPTQSDMVISTALWAISENDSLVKSGVECERSSSENLTWPHKNKDIFGRNEGLFPGRASWV